jgi:hypothetical protein
MITQHIGNETTIYTLSSGTEIVLKDYELKELMESNDVTKELLRQMNELRYDAQDYAKKCSNLRDTVHDLQIEISNLEKEKNSQNIVWHDVKEKMPKSGKSVLLYYKNVLEKDRYTIGHYTEKFTDENYDEEGEFYEWDEKTGTYYVPCGWYERSWSHCDYSGFWLENQEVLKWAEIPRLEEEKNNA